MEVFYRLVLDLESEPSLHSARGTKQGCAAADATVRRSRGWPEPACRAAAQVSACCRQAVMNDWHDESPGDGSTWRMAAQHSRASRQPERNSFSIQPIPHPRPPPFADPRRIARADPGVARAASVRSASACAPICAASTVAIVFSLAGRRSGNVVMIASFRTRSCGDPTYRTGQRAVRSAFCNDLAESEDLGLPSACRCRDQPRIW
jgi:hypothetical protein